MLSAFTSYQIYARDLTQSLDRVAAEPFAKREAQYYKDNIGKVKSIDDFMKDSRLYTYAMKAYGLEDQTDSRALIKKVLQSDLSDSQSIANKLSDDRYRDLAKAFNFSTAAATTTSPTGQTSTQTSGVIEAYSEFRVRAAQSKGVDAKAYVDRIGGVTNVDQFLNDPTLLKVALGSVGIDSEYASRSFIRDVLTGNADIGANATDAKALEKLAELLPFRADGSVLAGGLQTASQANGMVYSYLKQQGLAATSQAAAYQVSYYDQQISAVRTADDFIGDQRLLDTALVSVGLDPSIELPAFVWQIVTSDPSDPDSALARMAATTPEEKARKASFVALNQSLNFDTQGNVPAGESAQDTDAATSTTDAYLQKYGTLNANKDRIAGSLYTVAINAVGAVSDFMSSDALYDYALKAFDLDPAAESRTTIRRVLSSDPSDPNSFVSKLGDDRYTRLAAAFNFDATGKATQQRLPQSTARQIDTANLYLQRLGDSPSTSAVAQAKSDTTAYKAALGSVITLDDFVGSKTIVDYVEKAYGLSDAGLSKDDLRKIFTSDLADPDSFANAKGDKRYAEMAAAFSFSSTGAILTDDRLAQSGYNMVQTQNLYLRQQMEEEAGGDNPGVRLALYFSRKAPDLTSSYGLLADAALYSVVRTTLGIPTEASNANVDTQKRTIDKRLDFDSLQDPAGLAKFINRFLALYDTENAASGSDSPALAVLTGSGGF